VNWPVAEKPEPQVCKTMVRGTRQAVDADRVQCEINILFIFIKFFIDFVFLIDVLWRERCRSTVNSGNACL
jgi:hypothetical protein